MKKLIQVELSRNLLKCSTGNITKQNFVSFVFGANTALAEFDCHYDVNESKIVEGKVSDLDFKGNEEEYTFYLNGFSMVMDKLKLYNEDVSLLEDLYATL